MSRTSSPRRRRGPVRVRSHRRRLTLEVLEDRTLLATMIWNNPSGGDWDVAANWVNQANASDHHIPTASDDAQINTTGITVTHANANDDSVNSLTSQANFVLSSGTLNVGTTLQSSGTFTLAGGTLASADVLAGTTLIVANNSNSILSPFSTLSGVTLAGTLDMSESLCDVNVTGGLTLDKGIIDLGSTTNSNYGQLNFKGAQTLGGTGSVVLGDTFNNIINNYSSNGDSGTLTIGSGITITGQEGSIGSPSDSYPLINQGTIDADVSGGAIYVSGSSISNAGTLEANGNGGNLITTGGALTSTGILEADGTSTLSLDGGSVMINSPGVLVVQWSATVDIAGSLLGNTTNADLYEAQGTVNFDGSGTSTAPQLLEAMSDDLGNVSAGFQNNFAYNTLAVGWNDYWNDYVRLVNDSNNSGSSNPEAVYVNTLIVPSGSTLDVNGLNLYAANTQVAGTITGGSITQITGPPTFTADTPPPAIVGNPFSYHFQAIGTEPITFSATGLPAWAQLDASTGILSGTPTAPGTFDFTVTASNGTLPNATASVSVVAQDVASTFTADTPPPAIVGNPFSYHFQAIGTEPITFSATGLPAWAQLDASTGILSGTPTAPGTFDFTVTASNGTLPNATASVSLVAQDVAPTFTADTPPPAIVGNPFSYQFQASGTEPITFSATGLPPWAQLDPSTGILSGTPTAPGTFDFTVTASNGILPNATASVSLVAQDVAPTFTADTPPVAAPGSPYSYQFQASGTEPITFSATGLPAWAQLNPSTGILSGTPLSGGTFDFTVTASNGTLPNATADVSLIVAAGGVAVTFNIAAGTSFTVPGGSYTGGTTFNVGAGATVTIDSGTSFTGGAVFNLGTGSVVNIIGATSFSGTLTGSGGGSVQLDGDLYVGSGGLTLNFAGSMFQWTGGAFAAALGDVTNLGTINLAGSSDKGFFQDGTLYNSGTIIQTGSGNLDLHSDNVSPTTLVNEAGASYLIESDSGIDNLFGGQVAVENAGTIRKTAGTGTSNFTVLGSITNTGTIEADSGTISLDPTLGIGQLSGNTLTAGTWSAPDGASLQFPTSTTHRNAANLILSGSGATITGISGLSSNSGSFTLTNGANFTTTGNFTNSGSLTVGAGSTLSVTGNETENSAGTLNVQIGGTPASGQFGQVAATGTATLAGTFSLALVNSFAASVGQDFKAMTFAGASGTFSTVNLGSSFTEAINPTSLDLNSTVANPTDLSLSNVAAPTAATAGQQITVTWQVTNQSTNNATGNWQDSVYLSSTPTITSSSILLGAAQHSGGLNANGSYNGTLSAPVPALAPGSYYVLVQADSLYQVSDPNRANNTLAAHQPAQRQPARSRSRHALQRFLHGSRPGSLLPGDRAGRWITQHCAWRAPPRPARRLSMSARDGCPRRSISILAPTLVEPAKPDGTGAAGAHCRDILCPGSQRFRKRRHGGFHAHGHTERRLDSHLDSLGAQRQRRQRHRRDRWYQLRPEHHRQPDPEQQAHHQCHVDPVRQCQQDFRRLQFDRSGYRQLHPAGAARRTIGHGCHRLPGGYRHDRQPTPARPEHAGPRPRRAQRRRLRDGHQHQQQRRARAVARLEQRRRHAEPAVQPGIYADFAHIPRHQSDRPARHADRRRIGHGARRLSIDHDEPGHQLRFEPGRHDAGVRTGRKSLPGVARRIQSAQRGCGAEPTWKRSRLNLGRLHRHARPKRQPHPAATRQPE